MIAGALGLMFGFSAAWLRESIDSVFRTTRQVEQILKTNCLAVLPIVKSIITPVSPTRGAPKSAQKIIGPGNGTEQNIPGLFRQVVHEPLSSFAEGFRAIKVAADINGSIKENKVIGITSSLPHEGKSTVASNFAELIAHGGSKVILIDGDLRNPTISRRLAARADIGLIEVLSGKAELRQAIHIDELTGLALLPAVIESRLAHSSEILASAAFRDLIEGLRKIYDYIIIDFPPLAPVVDVRATTHIVDSYVFVVEWGRTRLNMVQRQLSSSPEIFDRLLGVVLNKANVRILDRYEDYYGRYYYKKNYYARYGYTH
jgi:succinoglycan biosynthesis transport protein ExoP